MDIYHSYLILLQMYNWQATLSHNDKFAFQIERDFKTTLFQTDLIYIDLF